MSGKKKGKSNGALVVLYNETQNAGNKYHICEASEFKAAKDQPGYNWVIVHSAEEESECLQFIEDQSEEK